MNQLVPVPALFDAAVRALASIGRPGDTLRTHWVTTERAIFFQAEPEPPVFIKVYLNTQQLEREFAVMRLAAPAGIPVAPVIAFEAGSPAVLITEQVPGVPLASVYPKAAEDAGRLLRRFHALGASPPFADGQAHWSAFVRDCLERELTAAVDRQALTTHQARRLRTHFAALAPVLDARPVVLIHGDCQTDHILIDPETQIVTALLDLVDAQPGDPLFDIAVLTLFDRALEPLLLRGYGVDNREALDLLPAYRVLRYLGAANWLITNGVPHLAPPHEQAVQQFIEDDNE